MVGSGNGLGGVADEVRLNRTVTLDGGYRVEITFESAAAAADAGQCMAAAGFNTQLAAAAGGQLQLCRLQATAGTGFGLDGIQRGVATATTAAAAAATTPPQPSRLSARVISVRLLCIVYSIGFGTAWLSLRP